ncbi:AAA domain-containing protein [Helicobacter pylori]
MLPFIVGGAILAVGFGALAFFFDVETEKEKERQNTLKKDIKDYTHKAQQAKKRHKHQQTLKIADHCLNIIQRYLQEIERLQQEKKETPTQLKAVLEQIQQEMKSLPIQQKHALQIYYNRFEDAQRRALAYLGYLSRLKIQLQEKEKRLKSDLGEIKKLEQKVKKNNENIASNQEWLERHREWRDESQSNNPDNADKMQERMDRNKDNIRKAKDFIAKTQKRQNKEDNRFFKASLCKGLLYKHILEESVFEVSPKYENAIDCKMTWCLFHGIHLLLPIEYKEFKHKKYTPRDTLKVWVTNYDSLLKSVFIAEKEPEPKHMDVIMLFNDRLGSQILKYTYIFNDFNLNYSVLDYQKNVLTLGIAHLMLKCRTTPNHLVLQEIRELPENFTEKFNDKIFPLERGITFVYEKEKGRYDELAVALGVGMEDMLVYIQTQMHLSQIQAPEYDPFKKWQQIIEHQIQTNSYTQISYQSYTQKNHQYTFKTTDPKIEEIESAIEAKVDGFVGEKAVQRIGKVIGGVDKTNKEICIEFKSLGVEFPQEGFLFLRTDYIAPLERQKKALERFNKNEIVNQDLKRFLLDPKIIFYTPLGIRLEKFYNQQLTKNQKEIVLKALNEKNIFLIQGPPGAGKTTVIKEIVFQILNASHFAKVCIISQQNIAVDNVLNGLQQQGIKSIVRIGKEDKVQYENIKPYVLENWWSSYKEKIEKKIKQNSINATKNARLHHYMNKWHECIKDKDFRDIDNDIKQLLISQHQILGATCVGLAIKNLGIELMEFDVTIVDEAGRATAPEILIPALRTKKLILIGDHNQLPPSIDRYLLEQLESDDIQNLDAIDRQLLEESFFENLYKHIPESNKAMLNEQFRMPAPIGSLVSQLFYKEKLKNGVIKNTSQFYDPKNIIRWINVEGEHELEKTSSYNKTQVQKIIELLEQIDRALNQRKIRKTIGIITPYNAQKRRLRSEVEKCGFKNFDELKIDTVDAFQGEEADIIIYSTVKTYGNLSFLLDSKRLNVAISRAKENLIFVGKKSFFENLQSDEKNIFSAILQVCR